MTEHIKVVYYDGEPIVYRDGNILNEKETVGLLMEFFEDCDTLINENEKLKQTVKKVLQKNYDYTKLQRQKNLDNVIAHNAYDLLRATIRDIADDLEVKLEL